MTWDEPPPEALEPPPTLNGTRPRGRTPPHDPSAETALLGAMMLSTEATETVLALGVDASHFYSPLNGAVLDAIRSAFTAGAHPPDAVSVRSHLTPTDLAATDNGHGLLTMCAAVPSTTNVATYAHRVLACAEHRRLLTLALELTEATYTGDPNLIGNTVARLTTPAATQLAATTLTYRDLLDVAADVDAAPTPGWLLQPIWPEDAHGVIGAEDKAGKTWEAYAIAVCVAAGRPWLGTYPVERPGPVLVFAGEGSPRKTIRRLRAIGNHYGLTDAETDALPIRVCHRVPHLSNASHLASVHTEVEAHPPRLIILDPLYLAARGAEASQLLKMAEPLEAIQHAAANNGAALIVVHHWNKTGNGTDRNRFSGAGPKEWGRILASMSVLRRTTTDNGRSVVDLKVELIGDEIADDTFTFRRTVWTDNDHLDSPMHYRAERTTLPPGDRDDAWDGPTQCVEAIRTWTSEHLELSEQISQRSARTRLRAAGLSYRDETIFTALEILANDGHLIAHNGPRGARLYQLREGDNALDF